MPQNLKQFPTWFDVYLVNVKSSGRLFQIFVSFSECPNFSQVRKKFSFYVQDMHLPIVAKEQKEDRIKILVDYFSSNRNNHTFYAIKFFGCEVLNFINVLGQIYFMDFFLGGTYLYLSRFRISF